MDPSKTETPTLQLPPEVEQTFKRANAYLLKKYDGVAPSVEELIIFYLASVEAHEVVVNLERQVLQVSGKSLPEHEDHLVQTYLDMEHYANHNP